MSVEISDDLYARVAAYRQVMSLAKTMLSQGVISPREYDQIDTIMTKKYGLSFGTIFR